MPPKARRNTQRAQSPRTFLEQLPLQIGSIFDQAQTSVASHHKNIAVALYELYVEAGGIRIKLPKDARDGDTDSGFDSDSDDEEDRCRVKLGEEEFEKIIYFMVLRLLNSKKDSAGDRSLKFFAAFVHCLHEKAVEQDEIENGNEAEDEQDHDVDMDSGYGGWKPGNPMLLLGQINSSLYYALCANLLHRITDRDWTIRQQAAIALCMFYRVDDPDELEEMDLSSLSDVLLEALACDPKEQIRLSSTTTLSLGILGRTRDNDIGIRREAYAVLEKNVTLDDASDGNRGLEDAETDISVQVGRTHPRNLTIFQRDSVIKNGLGDRDSNVRDAAVKLLTKWIGAVAEGSQAALLLDHAKNTPAQAAAAQKQKQKAILLEEICLVRLLRLFNLRATNERTIRINWRTGWTRCYPVTMALAFYLQDRFNVLVEAMVQHGLEDDADEDDDDVARAIRQDDVDDKEFVTIEVVKIALHADYGDEIGRRKMEQLVRDLLVHNDLPEGLIAPCVALLKKIAAYERDMIRIVSLDVIQTLRDENAVDAVLTSRFDSIDVSLSPGHSRQQRAESKNSEELSEREKERRDKVDMRCLCICEAMLELVKKVNKRLIRPVNDLVHSCASRRMDDNIKEKAFRSEELWLVAVQLSLTILLWYAQQNIMPEDLCASANSSHQRKALTVRFINVFRSEKLSEDMRALLCAGLVKLMNDDVIVNKDTFMPVFLKLSSKVLDSDDGIVSLEKFANILLAWTHPEHLRKKEKEKEKLTIDDNCIHFRMAFEIIKELLNRKSKLLKDHKRILCKLLAKVYLPQKVDAWEVRNLEMLMGFISAFCPLPNVHSRNALKSFYDTFVRKYKQQLEAFSEDDFRALEGHLDKKAFVDNIMNAVDNDESEVKNRKRKLSAGIGSATHENLKSKRARSSTFAGDIGEEDTVQERQSSKPRTSTKSIFKRRSLAAPRQHITISDSDSEGAEEEEVDGLLNEV
ncbi:hypothetical protein BT96DRAFT_935529 [Gymnopus androsaceus JB14]|uniref:Nuclear condensin complex subunit 3 C-terminal domain-containing protein n=1 Tax=Gymnopus androsaceus JB14 TaxID=1447944 RepID=A0A6A4I718_9AGAR|nr:hypothetical protein BT96DRAFT_935529 [Gymnopus androsaceus JB14]